MSVLAGIVCGVVAAAPLVALMGKDRPALGPGIAAVAFSFLVIQTALMAVRLLRRAEVLPFGVAAVATLLAAVVVATIFRERGQRR